MTGIRRRAAYYAFAMNDFAHERVGFTLHKTLKAALKAAYKACKGNSGIHDFSPHVIKDDEMEPWAIGNGYEIDWTTQTLIILT